MTVLQLRDQAVRKDPGSQNSLHPAEASGGRGSREQAPKRVPCGEGAPGQVWGAAVPPAGLGAPSANDLVLRLAELHGEGERDAGPFPQDVGSWKVVAVTGMALGWRVTPLSQARCQWNDSSSGREKTD